MALGFSGSITGSGGGGASIHDINLIAMLITIIPGSLGAAAGFVAMVGLAASGAGFGAGLGDAGFGAVTVGARCVGAGSETDSARVLSLDRTDGTRFSGVCAVTVGAVTEGVGLVAKGGLPGEVGTGGGA